MSMPTDDEMNQLLYDDPGPVTNKIRREIAVALRQVQDRQKQVEQKVTEHESFIARLRRGLGAAVKG